MNCQDPLKGNQFVPAENSIAKRKLTDSQDLATGKSLLNMFNPRNSATDSPKTDKETARDRKRQNVERGNAGCLHEVFSKTFRRWIDNEISSERSSKKLPGEPSIEKRNSIRTVEFDQIENWHSFKESAWPDMKIKIEEAWARYVGEDTQKSLAERTKDRQERVKVFYRHPADHAYVPESEFDWSIGSPGKYVEMVILMRDLDDWFKCTNRASESGQLSLQRQHSTSSVPKKTQAWFTQTFELSVNLNFSC